MPATSTEDIRQWLLRGCPINARTMRLLQLMCNDRRAVIRNRCRPTGYWELMRNHYIQQYLDLNITLAPQSASDDSTPIGWGGADDTHDGAENNGSELQELNLGEIIAGSGMPLGAINSFKGINLYKALLCYQTNAEWEYRRGENLNPSFRTHYLWNVDGMIGFWGTSGTGVGVGSGTDESGVLVAYANNFLIDKIFSGSKPFNDVAEFFPSVLEGLGFDDTTDWAGHSPSQLGPSTFHEPHSPVTENYLTTLFAMYGSLNTAAMCTTNETAYDRCMRNADGGSPWEGNASFGTGIGESGGRLLDSCLDEIINRTGDVWPLDSSHAVSTFWNFPIGDLPDNTEDDTEENDSDVSADVAYDDTAGPKTAFVVRQNIFMTANPLYMSGSISDRNFLDVPSTNVMHMWRWTPNLRLLQDPPPGFGGAVVSGEYVHSRLEIGYVSLGASPEDTFPNTSNRHTVDGDFSRYYPYGIYASDLPVPVVEQWTPEINWGAGPAGGPGQEPPDTGHTVTALGEVRIYDSMTAEMAEAELPRLLQVYDWSAVDEEADIPGGPGEGDGDLGSLPPGNEDGSGVLNWHMNGFARRSLLPRPWDVGTQEWGQQVHWFGGWSRLYNTNGVGDEFGIQVKANPVPTYLVMNYPTHAEEF